MPVSSTPADKRLHPGYGKVNESSIISRPSCSNKEHDQGYPDKHKHVRFKTEEKRTGSPCPFDGQVSDIALNTCGLSTTLFLSQNGKSREPSDSDSPLFRSLPLNVEYVVDTKDDLTSFACAHGDNIARRGNLATIVNDLENGQQNKADYRVTSTELTMPCLRETVMNVHNSGAPPTRRVYRIRRLVRHCAN